MGRYAGGLVPLRERFTAKCGPSEDPLAKKLGCIDWYGSLTKPQAVALQGDPSQYRGTIWVHGSEGEYGIGTLETTGRAAWFLATGAWPPVRTEVLRCCERPRCVAPSHLYLLPDRATRISEALERAKGPTHTDLVSQESGRRILRIPLELLDPTWWKRFQARIRKTDANGNPIWPLHPVPELCNREVHGGCSIWNGLVTNVLNPCHHPGCTANHQDNGYGQVKLIGPDGKCHNYYAHRLSFAYHSGRDTFADLCHICNDPRCQCPSHFLEVTEDLLYSNQYQSVLSQTHWQAAKERCGNLITETGDDGVMRMRICGGLYTIYWSKGRPVRKCQSCTKRQYREANRLHYLAEMAVLTAFNPLIGTSYRQWEDLPEGQ